MLRSRCPARACVNRWTALVGFWLVGFCLVAAAHADELTFPPKLKGGKAIVTIESPALLKPITELRDGVTIAKTAPKVEVMYFPEQTYAGNPWSVWGDGVAVNGKYYSAIGDHKAPDGNAYVYEYDPETRTLKCVVELQKVIKLPEGHYRPGKIHSRIDLGKDGCLYFSTHRGSTRITTDEYHYKGDWILKYDPRIDTTEIVAHGPAGKQCIPTSVLDPERMIFYGGTAPGDYSDKRVGFFAYDVANGKLLHQEWEGAYRYFILANSTGRVYFAPSDEHPLKRFDPAEGGPAKELGITIGLRAATQETSDGIVYTVSGKGDLYAFDVKTEKAKTLGNAAVGTNTYIASLDADATGRYLYYVAGAHGGGDRDGTPIVQYDLKTKTKKVLCFLHPTVGEKTGYVPTGTYSLAVDPEGDKLYITWNGNRSGPDRRGRLPFDTCAMTVIHVPASERPTQ